MSPRRRSGCATRASAVESRRAELVAASRDSEGPRESSRTRDGPRYDYAANREEAKDLDEIGMVKHIAETAAAAQEVGA